MRALMLIKQADDNNGISPLAATGLTATGIGVGALGMRWHKNKQIGQLNNALDEADKKLKSLQLKGATFSTNKPTDFKLANPNVNSNLGVVKPKLNSFGHNIMNIFRK